jgi:crotonobetainyl-CoA:carnitine CoA-transferase CaiB-like acyl-CoA transferase
VLRVLDEYEVVCAAVNDARDVVADPHFRERTLVELTGNSVLGPALMPGPILHLAHYPGPSYHGVPELGEHTSEVLADWLGLSETRLAELVASGTVLQAQAAAPSR